MIAILSPLLGFSAVLPSWTDILPGSVHISLGILNGLWAVCSSLYERSLFHAASFLALYGALCVSVLVPASKMDAFGKALKLGDVSFY